MEKNEKGTHKAGLKVVWSEEASLLLSKVPFFVRKKVKKLVEKQALEQRPEVISAAFVRSCQQSYLQGMAKEVRGYRVEACFGYGGCPNRVFSSDELQKKVEARLHSCNILDFLKKQTQGQVKFHHEFRVTFADCPNACSRPQIVDFGIIACLRPGVDNERCTQCQACAEVCLEWAIRFDQAGHWALDRRRCLGCAQCVAVCPTAALESREEGYRVLLGGKLGRHPRLGQELPVLLQENQVIEVLELCLDFFLGQANLDQKCQAQPRDVLRLGDLLNESFIQTLLSAIGA